MKHCPPQTASRRARARAGVYSAVAWLGATAMGGCTSLLGIDNEYVLTADASGGSAAGGTAGSATGASGGVGGGTRCADNDDCAPGKKCCGGSCVAPSPAVGCSDVACDPCPVPIANSEPFCEEARCSARCRPGYKPGAGACVLDDGRDGGGVSPGGTGGTHAVDASGTCVPQACPRCSNPVQGVVPCCDAVTNECGCSWFQAAYCVN